MAKKQLKGSVVSNKMTNTVVVRVEQMEEHAKYKKRYKIQKKYKADTAGQSFNIGDVVLMEECRPISKEKKWKVIKKLAESKSMREEDVLGEIEENKEEITKENKEQK